MRALNSVSTIKKVNHSLTFKMTRKDAKSISLVGMLREKLASIDPKTRRTYASSLIAKYYKMAKDGDPIIMRDLINRIDGLPKQVIANDKDNPININVIHSLFGQSVRQATTIEYDSLTLDDDEQSTDIAKPNQVWDH